MDPRNANNGSELRLNIDPNAFQLALRNGTLTLVPRITPNPNPPLIQLPIQNAANGNQITAPTSQTTYENALTMHYAGQNTNLNEEQYQFLKHRLQLLRGSIDQYEQLVEQRHNMPVDRNRTSQPGRPSSNAIPNQSRTTATDLSFASQASSSNQAAFVSERHVPTAGIRSGTFNASLQQQAKPSQAQSASSSATQNVRNQAAFTRPIPSGSQRPQQPAPFRQVPAHFPQQVHIPPVTSGVSTSNQAYTTAQLLHRASSGAESTTNIRQTAPQAQTSGAPKVELTWTWDGQRPVPIYRTVPTTSLGSENITSLAPTRRPSLQSTAQEYANLYHRAHAQVRPVPLSNPNVPLHPQAHIPLTTPQDQSRVAQKSPSLKPAPNLIPTPSFDNAAATQPQETHLPVSSSSAKSQSASKPTSQMRLPPQSSHAGSNRVLPTSNTLVNSNAPSTPPRDSSSTGMESTKRATPSVARAIISLFGKRKATESPEKAEEPSTKKRATTPHLSGPASTSQSQQPKEGPVPVDVSVPGGLTAMQEGPKNVVKTEARDLPDTLGSIPLIPTHPNSSTPAEPSFDVPNTAFIDGHLATPLDVVESVFITPAAEIQSLNASIPRIETLADDISLPPPVSRSPSSARQASAPKSDVLLPQTDAGPSSATADGINTAPMDEDSTMKSSAHDRTSEPLFLPETDGSLPRTEAGPSSATADGINTALMDEDTAMKHPTRDRTPEPLFLPETSSSPKGEAVEVKRVEPSIRKSTIVFGRPRRAYVAVPIPQNVPNPLTYGPERERRRKLKKEKRWSNLVRSPDEGYAERGPLAVGPPRKALYDGYEKMLRSEDAIRLAPRSCEWHRCDALLDTLRTLELHVKVAHIFGKKKNQDRIVCRWKGCHIPEFATRHSLEEHMKKHLVARKYCMRLDCTFFTRSAHALSAHIREEHNGDISVLKPTMDSLFQPPPIPEHDLPHTASYAEALPLPVYDHPKANLQPKEPSPKPTLSQPQSLTMMPLSAIKHHVSVEDAASDNEDHHGRHTLDHYSFLEPFYKPKWVMDELEPVGINVFLSECLPPEWPGSDQRAGSADELLI